MKIICLHGAGENPRSFRTQCAVLEAEIRAACGYDTEFRYFAAPLVALRSNASDGPLSEVRSYFDSSSRQSIEASVAVFLEYIVDTGPYDAVLAFSFGAAFAMLAIIIHNQIIRRPAVPKPNPLFRFAVFVCGVPPQLVLHLPREGEGRYGMMPEEMDRDGTREIAQQIALKTYWDVPWVERAGESIQSDSCYEGPMAIRMHGLRLDLEVLARLPTLHVHGGMDDSLFRASEALRIMFSRQGCPIWEGHYEGHRMPQSPMRARALAYEILRLQGCTNERVDRTLLLPSLSRDRTDVYIVWSWCRRKIDQVGDSSICERSRQLWERVANRYGVKARPNRRAQRPAAGEVPQPTGVAEEEMMGEGAEGACDGEAMEVDGETEVGNEGSGEAENTAVDVGEAQES